MGSESTFLLLLFSMAATQGLHAAGGQQPISHFFSPSSLLDQGSYWLEIHFLLVFRALHYHSNPLACPVLRMTELWECSLLQSWPSSHGSKSTQPHVASDPSLPRQLWLDCRKQKAWCQVIAWLQCATLRYIS